MNASRFELAGTVPYSTAPLRHLAPEQQFHILLRSLYAAHGVPVAPLVHLPPETPAVHIHNSRNVTSPLLHAAVVLNAFYTLHARADFEHEQLRAWQRTEARTYGHGPTYRASAFRAGTETLALLVDQPSATPTPLLTSTAVLRTTRGAELEVAEVDITLGGNTPLHEALPLNENGFVDTRYYLGKLAVESQMLLAA